MNNKLILVAVLVFFSVINHAQTKIIAHRGFSNVAPENTLIAFQKAIEIGADYYELDVHQTKDGVLVVIHDKTIDRTCSNNKTGKISELNICELQDIRVGLSSKFGKKFSAEKIPTLKEALELARNKIGVCVEIKTEGIESQVVKLLDELDMINQIIIFSFSHKSLLMIKELNSEIRTLLLVNYANIKTLDFVNKINANAIGVGYNTKITEEFITYAHKNGINVFKWTVNEKEKMKELINLNIDGIITNKPDLALDFN